MFKPRHFAARHFAPSHFVGRASVIIVTDKGLRHGIVRTGPEFKDQVSRLIREDEEVLLMVVSFIEVYN